MAAKHHACLLVFATTLMLLGVLSGSGRADYAKEALCHSATEKERGLHDFPTPEKDYPSGSVIEICSASPAERYFFVSPPAVSPVGVCEVSKREIFSSERDDGTTTWTFESPASGDRDSIVLTLMALKAGSRCPTGSGAPYIPTMDLSPGVFVMLTSFWSDVVKSRGTMLERQVASSNCGACAELVALLARGSRRDDPGSGLPVDLVGMGLYPGTFGETKRYSLTIGSLHNHKMWQINGDLQNGAFVAQSVHSLL